MRLIHASDLHLGASWYGVPRRTDQERVLEEILDLCDKYVVDGLIVTGDVFSDRVEGGRHPQIARRLLEQLRGHLNHGRAVFLLRGNHDPLDLFGLMRLLVTELAGHEHWPLIVADLPGIYHIPGHELQIIALPYITPGMLRDDTALLDLSPEQQLPGLAGLLSLRVQHLYRQASSTLPAIFAGHVMVGGAHLSEEREFEAGYNDELWLESGSLPQFTSYNALGHIHLSQEIMGTGKPTWYAGSPDRMDLGEREYHPQVLLVDTPNTPGGTATVQPIPLTTCTPFIEEELHGMEDVDRLCISLEAAGSPDPLGRATIADVPVQSRGPVEGRIRLLAPRLQVRWALEEQALVTPIEWDDPHDLPTMMSSYLERAYAGREDRRIRLMTAFQSLWGQSDEVML